MILLYACMCLCVCVYVCVCVCMHPYGIPCVCVLMYIICVWRVVTVKLWNLSTHTCIRTIEGHTDCVRALCRLPNGYIASASIDRTVRIWDTEPNRCVCV